MDINITVIVPVYNVENYLIQCLDSIVEQSVSFDEVILINDGSVDNSLTICEKYISKYNNFRLINQKNRGLSVARNVGLNYATSEYVMFLDSDDCLKLDTVKKLKKELITFRYDAIYFDADIQCERDFLVKQNIYDRKIAELNGVQMSGQEFFLRCYPDNYIASACMAIYKKSIIKGMGLLFPEGLYYEDNYFTFVFMNYAKCVTYIPEKLYTRRYRKDSITTSLYSEKKCADYIKIMLMIWEEILYKKDQFLLEENSIFLKYINSYCRSSINNYQLCKEQNIFLESDTEICFSHMVEIYELLLREYHFDDNIGNLVMLNQMLNNLKQIIIWRPEREKNIRKLMKKITNKQMYFYGTLLCGLPLNIESCKVGIYGTGRHTEGLLAVYEKLIGKITCNLIFIDSYKGNRTYLNRKVIQYQEIDTSFDLIIISSFLYRYEMIKNVRKIRKEIPIYDFYKNLEEDIFSEVDLMGEYIKNNLIFPEID